MEKQPLYVLDSYPALADVARVRYWLRRVPSRLGHLRASSDGSRCSVTCAMVKRGSSESRATSSLDGYAESRPRKAIANRDPQAPRSRKALHGRGVQFLELRGTVCGTLTTVQNFPIKREQCQTRLSIAEREESRTKCKDTLLWIRRGDTIKF